MQQATTVSLQMGFSGPPEGNPISPNLIEIDVLPPIPFRHPDESVAILQRYEGFIRIRPDAT